MRELQLAKIRASLRRHVEDEICAMDRRRRGYEPITAEKRENERLETG